MASLFDRLSKFARTPQGRRVIEQATTKAQQFSKDPANRAKIEKLRAEVTKRVSGNRRPPQP